MISCLFPHLFPSFLSRVIYASLVAQDSILPLEHASMTINHTHIYLYTHTHTHTHFAFSSQVPLTALRGSSTAAAAAVVPSSKGKGGGPPGAVGFTSMSGGVNKTMSPRPSSATQTSPQPVTSATVHVMGGFNGHGMPRIFGTARLLVQSILGQELARAEQQLWSSWNVNRFLSGDAAASVAVSAAPSSGASSSSPPPVRRLPGPKPWAAKL